MTGKQHSQGQGGSKTREALWLITADGQRLAIGSVFPPGLARERVRPLVRRWRRRIREQ